MRGAAFLLLVAALSSGPGAAAPPRSSGPSVELLLLNLDLEKKGRLEDQKALQALTRDLERAESLVAGHRSRLMRLVERPDADAVALDTAEDDLADAEGRLRTLQDQRRTASSRLLERLRRIAMLSEELRKKRSSGAPYADPVTGRWTLLINPGPRKGEMRIVLDGTLVSGDYVLDGGFRGSLRGTFIGDKLSLQRVDSEQGIDANFYGRVNSQQKRIAGTWEATALAPATGPSGGTWTGSIVPEIEDDDSSGREEQK